MSNRTAWAPASCVLAATLCLVSSRIAAADDDASTASTGFRVGLRAGYGLGYGEAAKGSNLNRNARAGVPLWLDVGYLVSEHFYVGAYGSFGPVFRSACPSGATCSGESLRLGVNVHLLFRSRGTIRPWVGLGVGFEQLRHGVKGDGAESSVKYSGFELLQLQGGVDFPIASRFSLGPFVSASLASFSRVTSSSTVAGQTDEVSGSVTEKSAHGWLVVGLRATYDFF
jgi:hypothetical protein